MFAGFVGTFTGIKEGGFSISLNKRAPSHHWNPLDLLINMGIKALSI